MCAALMYTRRDCAVATAHYRSWRFLEDAKHRAPLRPETRQLDSLDLCCHWHAVCAPNAEKVLYIVTRCRVSQTMKRSSTVTMDLDLTVL
jgi:hypothetical protein